MKEEAILLTDGDVSVENDNMAKVLNFFGVPWRAKTIGEFLSYDRADHQNSSKLRLLCPAEVLLKLIEDLEQSSEGIRFWREQVHSIFAPWGKELAGAPKMISELKKKTQG